MIPRLLTDWTLEAVLDLLKKGIYENEDFDFKKQLPDRKDKEGKDRLRRTCCAFANSDGGFIVFGVSDDTSRSAEDRVIGLDRSLDFPNEFGNFPAGCHPSVRWDFRNDPPLQLQDGKMIHIIQIFKSWKAPHATGYKDDGWKFTKRTNKGNEGMNMDEIRSAFLGFYEKRIKLQLLRSELQSFKHLAENSYVEIDGALSESEYSLVTFGVNILEAVLSDTYTILADQVDLLGTLTSLRQLIRIANTNIQLFFRTAELPMTNKTGAVRNHNKSMREMSHRIITLCDQAIQMLDSFLDPMKI